MDRRFTVEGAIKDGDGRLQLDDYLELKAQVEDGDLPEGREGLDGEELPEGLRRWKDEKGHGWVVSHPANNYTRWFNCRKWGSWRMAFLLARLQRELWAQSAPAKAKALGRPKASPASPKKRGRPKALPKKRGRPKAKPKAKPKARPKAKAAPAPKAPQGRGLKRPAAPSAPSAPCAPLARAVEDLKVMGGRHRALALFNLSKEMGREALANLMKDGFTVLRQVFSAPDCDAAVDKIWDFAMGRCPNLNPVDESTWTSENWSQVARGKNLVHFSGAGWVLWEERLRFRQRLVELGVYSDQPHHVSWDGFNFGRPSPKLWSRPDWDHTDQVLLAGESTGLTWVQGLIALNDMDANDGPSFECWPGSQQDEIFVPLQKTAGLCEAPNGSFRMLKDAGRGWLQGKGLKRQRVPVAAGDVILWDSRLVHQGGFANSAEGSRAVAAAGRRHRGCHGRMAQYVCLGLAEFTPETVKQKRLRSYRAMQEAVTLNHKPDAFECFKRGRHQGSPAGMAFPELPPEALQLHGLG